MPMQSGRGQSRVGRANDPSATAGRELALESNPLRVGCLRFETHRAIRGRKLKGRADG